jgi:hypothetical protein
LKLGVNKSGGSSDIGDIVIGSVTVDPPNIIAGAMADVTSTFSGVDAASNWMVFVSPMTDLSANLGVASVRVSADNQITLRFANPTLLSINQGSVTFAVMAVK